MMKNAAEIQFERDKNLKALGITAVTCAAIFLLFFLVSWSLPQSPPPPHDEGIEVNLGNSDEGMGDVPPQIPGEPSLAKETNYNPSPSTHAEAETNPEVAENKENDVPAVNTSTKPEVKKSTAVDNSIKNNKSTEVINTSPSPPKPKAVYAGGASTNSGGNNADSYNKVRNQGIAGGNGDQGKPNGNPNSDNYTGNGGTGNSGISISEGLAGRRAVSNTRFEDTYQYGGTVYVNVTVDPNGNVTSASLKQGSPFPDINKIAVKRAYQVKFSKGTELQTGAIKIKFENPKG